MVADILAKIRAASARPPASHLHGAPILPALPTLADSAQAGGEQARPRLRSAMPLGAP
jgi:hypothetical protein